VEILSLLGYEGEERGTLLGYDSGLGEVIVNRATACIKDLFCWFQMPPPEEREIRQHCDGPAPILLRRLRDMCNGTYDDRVRIARLFELCKTPQGERYDLITRHVEDPQALMDLLEAEAGEIGGS
jgi:hypothetical protein